MFVKNGLKELKENLQLESSRSTKRLSQEAEIQGSEEAQQRQANREEFLKITLSFLRQMKQDPLADALQRRKQMHVRRFQRNECGSPGVWRTFLLT